MGILDILARADLPFPRSLPEFQGGFPDDAACAAWLERTRWPDGFVCHHCETAAAPYRFAARPDVLRPGFRGTPLVASQTKGLSAPQFQRPLGLSRSETAFGILPKRRAGMVRPDRDREQGSPVEVDETRVGGRTRGEGRGVHHKTPVARNCAGQVQGRAPRSSPTIGPAMPTSPCAATDTGLSSNTATRQ